MENQKGINKPRAGWGWWVLIGVVIVCAVCVIVVPASSQVSETEPVPIHTTEAVPNPETFRRKQSRGGTPIPAGDKYPLDLWDRERYRHDDQGECQEIPGGGGFGFFCNPPPVQPKEGYAAEIRENYLDYPTGAPLSSPPPIWTSPPPMGTPPPIWTPPPSTGATPPPDTEEPECPAEVPGEYPDALDPDFRNCQGRKLAACYAKCHNIDPLYFFYNP